MRSSLTAVAHKLEATEHLANGEETEEFGSDDTTSSKLGGAEALDLLEEVLGRNRPALNRLDEVLVVRLEGGHGAVM